MRGRGMQFIKVPDSYYDDLRARLAKSKVTVKEDIETVSQPTLPVSPQSGFHLENRSKRGKLLTLTNFLKKYMNLMTKSKGRCLANVKLHHSNFKFENSRRGKFDGKGRNPIPHPV